MRVLVYCLLAWLVLALAGCSSGFFGLSDPGESYIRTGYDFSKVEMVAIVDVVGAVDSEVAKNQVSEYFTAQLLKKGYAPIERQRAQGLLSQQGFSTDHVHPELYAVEAGQALQVPVVMLISIPSFGDEISITAKLIEVNSGSALWLGRASKGYGKRRKSSSWGGDFTDDGFGDNFTASLYGYPNVGLGQAPGLANPEPMLLSLSLEEESRISDMVETLCKSLPPRVEHRGFGGSLLGLLDDTPARTPQAPAPRVRQGQHQPEPPTTPEVESAAVQEAPRIAIQEDQRTSLQEPVRLPVQEQPRVSVREPLRVPVQEAPRVPDPELRVISPGAPAPIQRQPAAHRPQKPKSIFEKGFADALAKQPVYVNERTPQNLTPPLQPVPQYRPEPTPVPEYRPEPTVEPVKKKTVWRRPREAQPEPKPKAKKSFWRSILGLD